MHTEDNAASEKGADRVGAINKRKGGGGRLEKRGRESDARPSGMYYSA